MLLVVRARQARRVLLYKDEGTRQTLLPLLLQQNAPAWWTEEFLWWFFLSVHRTFVMLPYVSISGYRGVFPEQMR